MTRLGGDAQDLVGGNSEDPFDLSRVAVGIGGGQVDLVEGGEDLLVVLEGLVHVGQRLRLDALRRINEEHHSLAGGQAAADFVAEVDVPRRVDQMDGVTLPGHPDVLSLDGDAPLALDVHRVEVLLPHVASVYGAGQLEDPIGQSGLPMIDVGHDAEVSNAVEVQRIP